MKVKVANILDSLNLGGSEKLAVDLADSAVKNNLDLITISFNEGSLDKKFENIDSKFIRLKRKKKIDLQLIKDLRKIFIDNNINIIHSHQAVECLHSYYASRNLDIKRVLSFHGYVPGRLNDFVLKYFYKKMDANVFVSNAFKNRTLKHLNLKDTLKNHIIYNGIKEPEINAGKNNIKKELHLNDDAILLGMTGNFVYGKDQLTICKALPKVINEFPEVRFLFIGKQSEKFPELYDECKDYCSKNNLENYVYFLGQREDLFNILNSLDMFVFSSLLDTFGIALVEAMFAGVPCIASDIPALKEISHDGKYCLLFSAENEKDLSEKIIYYLNHKAISKEKALQAQKYAKENFTIDNHISNLKKIYISLLEKHNS